MAGISAPAQGDTGTMTDELAFLPPRSLVAREMRAVDWAATPLGAPSGWPSALRQSLATMLSGNQGMFLAWGPDLTVFFNDAYRPHLGARAEGALGRRFADLWSDVWPDVEPIVARALAGEGQRFEDFPLTVTRNGFPEETWWTFSYDPLRDEEGTVRGLWCVTVDASARVLAERHARAERERLAAMFENAPGFFALLEGPEHRFAAVNPAYRRLIGSRDAVGRTVAEVLPEAEPQGFTALLDRVLETAEPHAERGARLALAPRPGEPAQERFLDFVCQPLRDAAGAATGIFVAGHDVTEAHRAQATLRDSEARFRLMADAVPQIVWILDGAGRTTFLNKQWFDYTGAPPDALGRPDLLMGYLHPDDVGPSAQAFAPLASGHGTAQCRQRIRRADGSWRWFLLRGEAHRDEATGQFHVYGASTDIHDQVLAQDALRDANQSLERRVSQRTAELRLLASIVETTDSIILVADTGFTLLGINRAAADAFERVYGVRPRVGDSLLDLLADRPEHQEEVRASWGRALAGESFAAVAEFGDPRLARRTFDMKFDALRDRNGRVTAAFQIATDVTERVRAEARLLEAEAQLRQSQKMEAIGQLTGGVAHDFNNLLTPIVGALDLLERRHLGTAREQRLIEGAAQSAERARVLVSRLLAFARKQPLEVGPVDLARLLEGLGHLVASTVGPQVRVDVHVGSDLPPATADANQLEMAILNLAVNARDAMPRGGALTVSAAREEVAGPHPQGLAPGTYLRLWVEDTGEGMDEATRARAVEPFFSTKGTGRGTGLGLSMVHGLALQLGGALQVESATGEGTRVTLWLPAARRGAPPPRQAQAPTRATPVPAGSALLVDDEPLVREATADMLAEMGYRVTAAASGEEALRLVEGGLAPDLLVTDHLMPGMSGTALALRLRGRWPGLPVLIVSGFAEAAGLSLDLPRLPKPFRRDELAGALDRARRGSGGAPRVADAAPPGPDA